MFCPLCRWEYEKGAAMCPDCKVPLVDEIPSENEKKELYEGIGTHDICRGAHNAQSIKNRLLRFHFGKHQL